MSGRSVSNAARIAQATVAAFAGAPATLRHAMATAATAATTPLARSRVAPAGWSTTRACRSTPRAALTPGAVETRASWSALAPRARVGALGTVASSRASSRSAAATAATAAARLLSSGFLGGIIDVAPIRPAPPRAISRAYGARRCLVTRAAAEGGGATKGAKPRAGIVGARLEERQHSRRRRRPRSRRW